VESLSSLHSYGYDIQDIISTNHNDELDLPLCAEVIPIKMITDENKMSLLQWGRIP
jgi:hypothetical protein